MSVTLGAGINATLKCVDQIAAEKISRSMAYIQIEYNKKNIITF